MSAIARTAWPPSVLMPGVAARSDSKAAVGVFATERLRRGRLLVVWGGDPITAEDVWELSREERSLCVQVDDGLFLFSRTKQPADCVNHSCDPNAGMRSAVQVVARRDIEAGEEICIDYAMVDATPYDEFECACGSERCRGRVYGADWTEPELQARYRGHFSPYLAARIARMHRG